MNDDKLLSTIRILYGIGLMILLAISLFLKDDTYIWFMLVVGFLLIGYNVVLKYEQEGHVTVSRPPAWRVIVYICAVVITLLCLIIPDGLWETFRLPVPRLTIAYVALLAEHWFGASLD